MDETLAFKNQATWTIYKDNMTRECGVQELYPMPAVSCPIVDTTQVSSNHLMDMAFKDHISPTGIRDIDTLVDRLLAIGATVDYPIPPPSCSCDPDQNRSSQTCPACQSVIRQQLDTDIPY